MCIDLRKRDTSRNRLLVTGQAIVPMLMILTTNEAPPQTDEVYRLARVV